MKQSIYIHLLQVLAADDKNLKALFRKGQAEYGRKNFDQALVRTKITHFRDILTQVP